MPEFNEYKLTFSNFVTNSLVILVGSGKIGANIEKFICQSEVRQLRPRLIFPVLKFPENKLSLVSSKTNEIIEFPAFENKSENQELET